MVGGEFDFRTRQQTARATGVLETLEILLVLVTVGLGVFEQCVGAGVAFADVAASVQSPSHLILIGMT